MPSDRRRFVVRHPVVVDVGCSCRKKLPSFFSCSSKPRLPRTTTLLSPSTTTSHWETSFTATTTTTATAADSSSPSRYGDCASPPPSLSYAPETPKRANAGSERKLNRKKNKGTAAAATTKKGVVEGSVAVVKDSSDPYLDFRDSMLQMIVEMEIYSWEGLRDLLHRLLALNADRHHHLILRAFVEIWNSLFSPCSPSLPMPSSSGSAPLRRRR